MENPIYAYVIKYYRHILNDVNIFIRIYMQMDIWSRHSSHFSSKPIIVDTKTKWGFKIWPYKLYLHL